MFFLYNGYKNTQSQWFLGAWLCLFWYYTNQVYVSRVSGACDIGRPVGYSVMVMLNNTNSRTGASIYFWYNNAQLDIPRVGGVTSYGDLSGYLPLYLAIVATHYYWNCGASNYFGLIIGR